MLTPAGAQRPQQALPLASWLQQHQMKVHAAVGEVGAAAAPPQAAAQPTRLAHLRLAQLRLMGGDGGPADPADSMAAASTDAGLAAEPEEQPFTPSAFLAEAPGSDDGGLFAGQSPAASGDGQQRPAAAAAPVATAASGVLDSSIAATGKEGFAALRPHAHPPPNAYPGLGRGKEDALMVRLQMPELHSCFAHCPPAWTLFEEQACLRASPSCHMPVSAALLPTALQWQTAPQNKQRRVAPGAEAPAGAVQVKSARRQGLS